MSFTDWTTNDDRGLLGQDKLSLALMAGSFVPGWGAIPAAGLAIKDAMDPKRSKLDVGLDVAGVVASGLGLGLTWKAIQNASKMAKEAKVASDALKAAETAQKGAQTTEELAKVVQGSYGVPRRDAIKTIANTLEVQGREQPLKNALKMVNTATAEPLRVYKPGGASQILQYTTKGNDIIPYAKIATLPGIRAGRLADLGQDMVSDAMIAADATATAAIKARKAAEMKRQAEIAAKLPKAANNTLGFLNGLMVSSPKVADWGVNYGD